MSIIVLQLNKFNENKRLSLIQKGQEVGNWLNTEIDLTK